MMRILLFILLILCAKPLFSQQELVETYIESDEWYKVYSSSALTVYVQFVYPPDNEICRSNSPITFMYRYKGSLAGTERYAVWELDYLDCGGITKKMTAYAPMSADCEGWKNYSPAEEFHFRDRDEIITARELIELRGLNKSTDSYSSPGNVEVTLKESIDPTRVTTTKRTVRLGEEITLSVEGGALGEGAWWKLYDGSCGDVFVKSFKERQTIIKPTNSTVYYVRAEGKNNETKCVEIEITVDKTSTPPSHIEGQSEVCEGGSVNLLQKGGELGPDSQWYWYLDACGTNNIGKGPSLEYTPTKTSVFYVRSESSDGNEIGRCVEKSVVVSTRPKGEVKMYVNGEEWDKDDPYSICEGDEVILKPNGELTEGNYWVWKEDNKEISRSIEVKRSPSRDVSIQLKMASDACGPSENYKSVEIDVYKRSISPTAINQKYDPNKVNRSTLVLEGGYLAEKSDWIWYYYNDKGKEIVVSKGKGESIDVERGWDGTTMYVKAEGDFCNDGTNSVKMSKPIEYRKKSDNPSSVSGFSLRYATAAGKWFHFGIQAGIDYFNIKDSVTSSSNPTFKQSHNIQSLAYFFGGELHPIFLDQFYMGIHGGYGNFFNNYMNYPQLTGSNNDRDESGSGSMTYFGTEMGWTISGEHAAKMFIRYTRTGFNNDLTVYNKVNNMIVGDSYINSQNITIDRMSLGFRFGAFDCRGKTNKQGNPKLGRPFDFMINFHNKDYVNASEMLSDFSSFSKFGEWKLGYELAYWKHNVFRIGFNMGFNSGFSDFSKSGNKFGVDYFVARFAYNFDLFR